MIFVFSPIFWYCGFSENCLFYTIFFFGIMNSVKKSGDKEHREAKRSNGYAPTWGREREAAENV